MQARGNWPAPNGKIWSGREVVRWSDLDLNRHAGALSCLDWLTGPLPPELVDGGRPAELDILFKGEAFLGDEIRISVSAIKAEFPNRQAFSHLARRESDDAVLATARTVWQT